MGPERKPLDAVCGCSCFRVVSGRQKLRCRAGAPDGTISETAIDSMARGFRKSRRVGRGPNQQRARGPALCFRVLRRALFSRRGGAAGAAQFTSGSTRLWLDGGEPGQPGRRALSGGGLHRQRPALAVGCSSPHLKPDVSRLSPSSAYPGSARMVVLQTALS